ncbi:unnamed protein product [Closterium sp. NIES-53]
MTLAVIEKYYYWPGMAADVQQFITSCDTCQRMKISKQTKAGLLQPLLVPEQPWQVVSLDFITGLPSTSRGHDAILVVIDKFSKMGHFIPTNATATTEATTHLFFDRIITIHGIPATLISYRDPKFTSNFLRELMGLLGTKLAMSSTYQPQTGGQTERLKYLAAMGEKYGLEEGRSVKTPLPSGFQLHLDEEEGEVLEYELQRRFQSMVGSLMYASVNTRPDIAFSVSQLARVVSRPLQEHLDAAERLVRYCMATSRVGLQYSVHGQLKQKGVEEVSTKIGAPARRGHLYLSYFTDATWASDISDATSHGGYICCVGGSPVSWKSKKQGEIAHSSTESEYMALFHGVKEVVWMRRLLEELGQEQEAIDFEVWLDDLQLFLQCNSKDGLSRIDLTSGASTAPTADADSTVRSQWLTRNAAARLAVRNHLPSTERAHFSQYKSARALYDAVVARYSSPTTAALSRLMLPYLFPDLAAFATVADLVAHLRTSDARYHAGSLSLPLPYRADCRLARGAPCCS